MNPKLLTLDEDQLKTIDGMLKRTGHGNEAWAYPCSITMLTKLCVMSEAEFSIDNESDALALKINLQLMLAELLGAEDLDFSVELESCGLSKISIGLNKQKDNPELISVNLCNRYILHATVFKHGTKEPAVIPPIDYDALMLTCSKQVLGDVAEQFDKDSVNSDNIEETLREYTARVMGDRGDAVAFVPSLLQQTALQVAKLMADPDTLKRLNEAIADQQEAVGTAGKEKTKH